MTVWREGRSYVFPDDRTDHRGDLEFLLRMNRLVRLIGRLQEDSGTPPTEVFHGPLPVDLGNDNIAVAGLCPTLHQEEVAGEDTSIKHRVPRDLEDIRGLFVGDQIVIEGHGVCQLFLSRRGKASRHGAKNRQPGIESPWQDSTRRVFFQECVIEQLLHQEGDGTGGAESRDGHKLAVCWHTLPAPIKGPNRMKMGMGVHY